MRRWQCSPCYKLYNKNVTGNLEDICKTKGYLPGFGNRILPIWRYNVKCPVCGHKWYFRRLRKAQ